MADTLKDGFTPSEAKAQFGATHYITMRDGVTPQMYYKRDQIQCNDDTVVHHWAYLSFCALWQGSNIKIGSEEEQRLVPIELTKQEVMSFLEYLDNEADEHLLARYESEKAERNDEKAALVKREMRNRGLIQDGDWT